MTGELELVAICIQVQYYLISVGHAVPRWRVMSQQCGQLPLSHQKEIG